MNDNNRYIIAIDGASATGKSYLARNVAKALDITYIDTGAMYRAFAIYFKLNNIEVNDENILKSLDNITIELTYDNNKRNLVILNGEDVTDKIRTDEISMLASLVSRNALVRKKLVTMQRELANKKSVVMDGRDISTVVFPNADVKIYVVADCDVRAKRRLKDIEEQGIVMTLEEVKESIKKRDYEDMNRKESPLKKAEDAIVVDTTNTKKEESVNIVLDIIKKRIGR